jgi:uncharacterized membrane protein YkvA (DUF1232 family)
MSLEDFDDKSAPEQRPILPAHQPLWAKTIAWLTILAGGLYMVNPGAGIFELVPDNLPVVGNLDEAAVVFIMLAAMRYLGMRLPEFIEQWARPAAGLSAGVNQKDRK